MNKIPTVFLRDPADRKRTLDQVHPECGWVLIGPRINGNPESVPAHRLVRHADADVLDTPRDFAGLRAWLLAHPKFEGIVWHHPDGRRAKLKHRDFARD